MSATSARRTPRIKPTAVVPTPPETDEEDLEEVEGQIALDDAAEDESDPEEGDFEELDEDDSDPHTVGGEGHHMNGELNVPIPAITEYPTSPDAVPPPHAFVVDDETEQSEIASWFEEDETNSNQVYSTKDIVRRIIPFNSVTPTFIQVTRAGVRLTKEHVNQLFGKA